MVTENVSSRLLKLCGMTALAGAVALGLGACATPLYTGQGGGQGDETRQIIVDGLDKLEADHRQIKSDLGNLNSAVDASNERTRNQIDDLSRQLKQQQQALERLQGDVQAVLAKVQAGGGAPASGGGFNPAPAPGPGAGLAPENPAPGAGTQGAQAPAGPTSFTDPAAAINAGKAALSQNQFDAARDAFAAAQKLATSDNQRIEALYQLGETAFTQRNYQEAAKDYTDAININSQSPQAWYSFERLGDIDRINGNNQAALEKYNTILTQWRGRKYLYEDRVRAKIAEIQSGAPAPANPGL